MRTTREQSAGIRSMIMRLVASSSLSGGANGAKSLVSFKRGNAGAASGSICEQLLLPGIAEPRRWNPGFKQHAA